MAGGLKQREPSAGHEQAAMLGEGLLAVDESRDVLQVPPYPPERLARRCVRG
jgi:hypothetical protein